ncbi:MAG TPA: NADH-quinone oxidoreductase subunit L [Capillimicrobium sp.]|nr:NADH-quinone oxidoreductase subunit L [Capillimicrobium sp.]
MSTTSAWLVLALPLAGTILIALGFKAWPGRTAGWLGTAAIFASFVFAVITFLDLQDQDEHHRQVVSTLFDYANTVGVDAKLTILVDPLSVLMILVVTGVSALIHLYSVTYMTGDRGFARYFAYLNFFVFSMLLLVLAGNFFVLIIGWAFVGAASYLLISFWYRRKTATAAGIKAFVINVVGDIGLTLGAFFIFKHTGTLDFLGTFEQAGEFGTNNGDLVAGLILLLVGAFAKSAQMPFHTWLADAMEGPTPVSSLIHAATMVTAGVYLIARMWPLFEITPAAAAVGAVVGCATLFIAATIGLAATDIKRVIAWSTMSQIGYMVMAVSSGAYVGGMFHFMTHAFFKALLFMGAGSVIGAMAGAQTMDKMGGFRRAMPFTFGCMVVGGLALAGIPPFSGFFSKDEILALLADRGGWHVALVVVGYLGAFITAIYTFRMIFRVFLGDPVPEARELEQGHLAHAEVHVNPTDGEVEDTDVGFPGPEHFIAEREAPMKVAMGLLAILAAVGGLVYIPHVTSWLHDFLHPTFAESRYFEELEPSGTLTIVGMLIGTAVGLAGIAVAYSIWVRRPGTAARWQARFPAVYRLLHNKWYFDEILDALFVRPAALLGRFAQSTFERFVVNGAIVGGATNIVRAGSQAVRAAQTGLLRSYAATLLLGVAAVILYFLIRS